LSVATGTRLIFVWLVALDQLGVRQSKAGAISNCCDAGGGCGAVQGSSDAEVCMHSPMLVESGGEMGLSLSRNLGGGGIGDDRGVALERDSLAQLASPQGSSRSAGDPKGDSNAMSPRDPFVSQLFPRSVAMMLSRSFCSSSESSKLELASVETRLALLVSRTRVRPPR
jgi:hypothetical protein